MPHVVINNITPRTSYSPTTGTSYTIPATWGFFASSDITVYSGTTALSYAATPSSSTNFATSGSAVDGGYQGGNIVLGAASTANTITLILDVPVERATDFPYPSATVNIEDLNTDLDKSYALMQQFVRDLARALSLADSDTGSVGTLPQSSNRAGKFFTFDSTGGATVSSLTLSGTTTSVSAFMATMLDDASASDARTTIGLGTLATTDAITSSGQIASNTIVSAHVAANTLVFADIQQSSASRLVGRGSGSSGDLEFITLAGATMSGTTLSVSSKLKQMVSTQTGAVATGTTIIPFDDTIPQNTEGDEYMTRAITPTVTTNKLKIAVVFNGSHSLGGYVTAALFQDATVNALAATCFYANGGNLPQQISFTHVMDAGTTSATTLKIRAGSSSTGTMTFNGEGGARRYGGVMASSIVIEEIEP